MISNWTQWKNYHFIQEIKISPLLATEKKIRSDNKNIFIQFVDKKTSCSWNLSLRPLSRSTISFESELQQIFFSRFSFSWCKLLIFFWEKGTEKCLKHKRCDSEENNFISQSWRNIKVDQVCVKNGGRNRAAKREKKKKSKYLFWPV